MQVIQMEKTDVLLVRKNANNLSNDELALFLAQMKTLYIMSPKEIAEAKNWRWNLALLRNPVESAQFIPQNRYDMLISSHATCCEHRAVFFLFWHRMHSKMIEQSIRRADELLKDESFPQNIYRMPWDPNSKILAALKTEENRELLKKFSGSYRQIRSRVKDYEAALHYFNFTGDLGKDGKLDLIKYPRGFTSQEEFKDGQEHIDKILSNVYNQKLWQLNAQKGGLTTWIQKTSRRYWFANSAEPRTSINKIDAAIRPEESWRSFMQVFDQIQTYVEHQQFVSFEKGAPVSTIVIPNRYLNFAFGGQGYERLLQKDETLNIQERRRKMNTAYCMLGRALKCVSEKFFSVYTNHGGGQSAFCSEQTHDYGHFFQLFPMSNAVYSITSPIFCLYHSYIDYILELKIRLLQKTPEDEQKAYNAAQYGLTQYSTKLNTDSSGGFELVRFNNWARDFKIKKGFEPSFIDYPIFMWMNFKDRQTTNLDWDSQDSGYLNLILDQKAKKLRNSLIPSQFENKQGLLHNLPYCFDILGPEDFGENAIPRNMKIMFDGVTQTNQYRRMPKLAIGFKHSGKIPTMDVKYSIISNWQRVQKRLLERIFVFLSRGEAAVDCPNCTDVIYREETVGYLDYIAGLFEKQQQVIDGQDTKDLNSNREQHLSQIIQKAVDKLNKRKFSRTLTVEYLNEPETPSKILYRIQNTSTEVQAVFLQGRANLSISLNNTSKIKATVNLELSEKSDPFSESLDIRSYGPYHLYGEAQLEVESFKDSQKRVGNITSIQGSIIFNQLGREHKLTFKYVFNYYANTSRVYVDIGYIIQTNILMHLTQRAIVQRVELVNATYFNEEITGKLLQKMIARGNPERQIEYILKRLLKHNQLVESSWYFSRQHKIAEVRSLFRNGATPSVGQLNHLLQEFQRGGQLSRGSIENIVEPHLSQTVQEERRNKQVLVEVEKVEPKEVETKKIEVPKIVERVVIQKTEEKGLGSIESTGDEALSRTKNPVDAIREQILDTIRADTNK